jgi:hypothetical protein
MKVTLTHQVMNEGREYGEPQVPSLTSPRLGEVGRRARTHMNGPPKYGLSPYGERILFVILFFGSFVVKSRALCDRNKDLSHYRSASLSVRG